VTRRPCARVLGSGDFSIGGQVWPGISKLIEECGEVIQVAGKLLGSRGEPKHWDGSDLQERMQEELGDLLAAASFVIQRNGLDAEAIESRRIQKLATFERWHRGQK
jgi:NTP pyrophosphatase (non-canonical NTP hydrolase)